MKDYYQILGVDKDATEDQIKKAYRKLAVQYHPDKNNGDKKSEEKFKELSEAYDTLGNPDKKRNYDTYGSSAGPSGGNPFGGGGFNMEDIFSQFGDMFGGGRRQQVRVGSDIRIKVQISLDDILKGCSKKIKFKKNDKCKKCDGKGGNDLRSCSTCNGSGNRVIIQNTVLGQIRQMAACTSCNGQGKVVFNKCSDCKGEGTTPNEQTIDINIPKGVSNDMVLTMSGNGNFIRDGRPGNLHIIIEEIPDKDFIRDGNDLMYDKILSLSDLILGNNISFNTPNGKIDLKVEPGTDSGSVFRFSDKGIPDVNSGRMGSLYVKIKVKIPKDISLEEKALIEKLKDSSNFNP
jgi:molecular chaperone DnaJ